MRSELYIKSRNSAGKYEDSPDSLWEILTATSLRPPRRYGKLSLREIGASLGPKIIYVVYDYYDTINKVLGHDLLYIIKVIQQSKQRGSVGCNLDTNS